MSQAAITASLWHRNRPEWHRNRSKSQIELKINQNDVKDVKDTKILNEAAGPFVVTQEPWGGKVTRHQHLASELIPIGAARDQPGSNKEQPEPARKQPRSNQDQPEAAKKQPGSIHGTGREQPGAAKSNQKQPGSSQGSAREQPGAAREQPGRARSSHAQPEC